MDQAVYLWFLSHRTDVLNIGALFWSSIWAPVWVWAYAGLIGVVKPVLPGSLQQQRSSASGFLHRRAGCVLSCCAPLISVLAASACSALLKRLIGRERPPEATRLAVETNPAFPSGHAVAAVALAAAVFFFLKARVLAALLAVNALAVGLTRLYLGVHWLSDVVAGYILGILVVWIAFRMFRRLSLIE